MRIPLPRASHSHPRPPAPEHSAAGHVGHVGHVGIVYGCEEAGCGKLALQSCIRCGQHFCTQHIRAWERDLPARGLKLTPPDWYCYQCRSYL